MFRGTVHTEEIERIKNLTEVKPMLAKLVDEIRAEEKRKGKLEGKQEGMLEGILEGKQDDARKMLYKGFPVEDVVEITGLSREEIEGLMRGSK